jgi:thiamine transport system ATP-binding protein
MLLVEQLQTQRQGRQFEFSLRLQPGEIGLLLGRSGSGKSTLLEMLAGFVPFTAGTLLADSQNIAALPPAARPFTMLFQQNNLFEHLTVRQNIGLGLRPNLKLSRLEQNALQQAAERLQISELLDRLPTSLSGGQQQRVSIARALANKPSIILADEPTGNLDSETGKKIFELLHHLSKRENTTIIVVTHDMEIAGKTDRTFQIRDGKLVA